MDKKRKIGLAVLAALLLAGLSSCILIDATTIKGDWKFTVNGFSNTLTYNFDGAGNITTSYTILTTTTFSGKYSLSGTTITLSSLDAGLGLLAGTYDLETPSATEMNWKQSGTTIYNWKKQ